MSEEKPTFKVTDRRLFNPDGTPRDIAREEEPAPAAATPEPEPTRSAAPPPPEPPADEPPPRPAPPEETVSRAAEREMESPADAPEAPGDEGFLMLVEFVASFAADALGMVNHPGGGGVNLPLAKQCIDMLGTLRGKTRGNLAGEEQQFLDMILSQLRMQYVSLTSAPRPPQGGGRGFTGGDITGGR
jgi:Domain of unknown function (DUF1844)